MPHFIGMQFHTTKTVIRPRHTSNIQTTHLSGSMINNVATANSGCSACGK